MELTGPPNRIKKTTTLDVVFSENEVTPKIEFLMEIDTSIRLPFHNV